MGKERGIVLLEFSAEQLDFVDHELTNMMLEFGLFPNIMGFELIKEATLILLRSNNRINMAQAYMTLAKERGISPNAVEKSIRHAIECSAKAGLIQKLDKLFQVEFVDGEYALTNHQFTALLYLLMKKRIKTIWKDAVPTMLEKLNNKDSFD